MIQHLVDVDYDRKTKLIASLEKSYRHFPKGALFLLISPMSGKDASEIMRWVETRGMNPCFLQITNSNETKNAMIPFRFCNPGDFQLFGFFP